MNKIFRIMLIEDNPQYREVVGLALEEEANLDLISQFSSAEKALENLEGNQAEPSPDLILLDLRLPGMDGLEALTALRAAWPETRVIILTQSDDQADILRAISLGSSGYLLKSSTADQLIEAIHSVLAGGAPLDAGVARFILDTLKTKMNQGEAEKMLTQREFDVLHLLSEGLVKKEISSRLKVSYSTVDKQVSNIYEKLGVSNAPAAISKAYRKGILNAHGD